FLRGITNSLDEIQRAFDFREFSYKQENSAIFAQAPVSAQFRSHRPESPALGTHVLRIDDMRHQKNTVQTCSVICEVLARPFASCEAGIKARDEAAINEQFGQSYWTIPLCMQMRIPAN